MIEIRVTYQRKLLKPYQFDKDEVVVGRDAACDIPMDNIGISRRHAKIEKHGDFYVLRDLGSENGVYVRGRRVHHYTLNHEDEIGISNYMLTFLRLDQPSCFATDGKEEKPASNFEVTMPLDPREMDRQQMERSSSISGHLTFQNLSGREDSYALLKSTLFLGSHQKSEFVCPGWFVGGKHALIVRDEFGFRLISLVPKRPVKVNGKGIDDHRLKEGDAFAVGRRNFVFHVGMPAK